MVIGTVKKFLKEMILKEILLNLIILLTKRSLIWGKTVKKCLTINDELEKYVIPNLLKWDKERIANVDMIFIKMSLAEVLYFESIPCNVTLNEYVELSKEYSTDKSKEFINGVMDKVIRDLEEKGLVKKLIGFHFFRLV